MKNRRFLKGFLAFTIFTFLISLTGITIAKEIPAYNPELYSLPHYQDREGMLFPEEKQVISLSTPITMGKCGFCHENLDDLSRMHLKKINHNLHFSRGISCSSCHLENPHTPTGVKRIPMRVCFSCHGLKHGPTGEVASGDCKTCHDTRKEPDNHTPAWKLKTHEKGDTHGCVICHRDINFCNDCHKKEGVRPILEKEYVFEPYRPEKPVEETTVVIKAPADMSDCYPCHRNIEDFSIPGLIFNHEKHFKKGIKCRSCHTFYPHQPDKTYTVPMRTCYYCHQVTHGSMGLIAPASCYLCHTKNFNLKPDDHTRKFESGAHKEKAYSDPFYCSMCHTDSFCRNCHLAKNVKPEDHKDRVVWIHEHGKDYEKQKYCPDCHKKDYCADCHGVEPIPHPVQYLATHGKQEYENKQVCNICHQDRTFCENCHHLEVAEALLKKENCIKCHPEYELPMLKIPSRGHMVHAAHFEMTNTAPFSCDKCHALGYTLGHDYATFQLCKECHGAYRLGKLIAKWNVDNGELCFRCHRPGSGLPVNVQVTPP